MNDINSEIYFLKQQLSTILSNNVKVAPSLRLKLNNEKRMLLAMIANLESRRR